MMIKPRMWHWELVTEVNGVVGHRRQGAKEAGSVALEEIATFLFNVKTKIEAEMKTMSQTLKASGNKRELPRSL